MRPGSRIPNGQEPSPVPAPPGQQAKDRPGPSDPHHPSSFRDGSTTMPSTTQYRRRGTTGRAARAGSCDRRGASMNIRRTVITVAAALALAAGGTAAGAVAFASSGTTYQGCVVGTSRILEHVYTRANPPACPDIYTDGRVPDRTSAATRPSGHVARVALQRSQMSWLIGESGMAIQPSVLAVARSPAPGGKVWPRLAARAVSAAMTASKASCERLIVSSYGPQSSHGAAARRSSAMEASASGVRDCL